MSAYIGNQLKRMDENHNQMVVDAFYDLMVTIKPDQWTSIDTTTLKTIENAANRVIVESRLQSGHGQTFTNRDRCQIEKAILLGEQAYELQRSIRSQAKLKPIILIQPGQFDNHRQSMSNESSQQPETDMSTIGNKKKIRNELRMGRELRNYGDDHELLQNYHYRYNEEN
ncbi:hypothetical protein RDWZM_004813 [Blomia tropicalis]|uniref:Uncharacterized protein n=1 Tax=Blomia tropicalis TaxID=40697 RepID=A0A9Q0M4G1_BLOTA|nr:hypothetical protein RDWZM_004813 [Blomia tropicalis]